MIEYLVHVVDDEKIIRKAVTRGFENELEVKGFSSAEEALAAIEKAPPDLVLLDIGLPGISGTEALKKIKTIAPQALVIMLTAYDDADTIISVMKQGADDYLVKPICLESLRKRVFNALETIRLQKEVQMLQEKHIKENTPCIIGESNAILNVMQFVKNVAKSPDTPILILGESGTGKDLIASAIHYKSPNFKGPYTNINCAAIPDNLIESELFGYEKGAFSGAEASGKKGLIEMASGGTLFLDEIGDLGLDAQAKLLRFLESGEFYRVGGTKKLTVKTRIVSATNKSLEQMIDDKLFRLDLYYRIGVIKVTLPSLNERNHDVISIARFFLAEFAKKFQKPITGLSAEAETALINHRWKGNIRELKNMIERAALIGADKEISLQDLGFNEIKAQQQLQNKPPETELSPEGFPPLPDQGIDLHALEDHFIREALKKAKGNGTVAAKLLNMTYYSFRYRRKKMKE
jgi:DNA-binding NtrC family response regulator